MTIADSRVVALEACRECGMPCEPNEYHPYAACLMFKACHDSNVVRANLQPLSLLAEAERERDQALEMATRKAGQQWDYLTEKKRADALQSRLDAVVAAVAKHRDTFPDEALPSELELWESIAALGCATTGEEK